MALVELERFSDGLEAQIVRGRLESEGIFALCFDGGMNIVESAGLMIQVRVMVDEEELDAARAILAEAEGR